MAGPIGSNLVKNVGGAYPSKGLKVPANWSRWMNQALSNGSTGIGGTSRIAFTAPYAMHDVVVDFYNIYESNGETLAAQFYTIIIKAVLEYPANTFYTLTFNGIGSPNPNGPGWYIQPMGKLTTDPLGISIPSGATFWVRTYLQIPRTPTMAAPTTSTTGGVLTAATYKYSVTALCGPGLAESAPCAAQSVTTTGSTSSNTIVLTQPLAADAAGVPVAYNIYRTTASTVIYFTTVAAQAGVTTWVDTGQTQPATVPVQYIGTTTLATYPLGPCAMAGTAASGPTPPPSGCNYVEYSGNGSNQLLTSGTAWYSSAGSTGNATMYGPCDVRGTPDGGLDVPVVYTIGDSIIAGTGDIYDRGYVHGTLYSNNIAYFNKCRLGEYATQWLAPYAPNRIQYTAGVSDIFEEINTNDINVFGNQLSSVQANDVIRWCDYRRRGPAGSIFPRIWRMTLLPRVATSDGLTTYANQEPGGMQVSNATNATPIVVTAVGSYLGNIGSPPVTTVPAGASSSATSLVVASAYGIAANMAFQVSGATYVVTTTSGTTINFTPALAANISAGATIVFGTTSSAGASLGATSVVVGYTGQAQNVNISNLPIAVYQNQIFTVGGNTYTVTAVNYGTNTVTFTPALTGTAIAAGGYLQFLSQVTIRNCVGNTAANGTFYVACSANTLSLYSDTLFQSPVSGNGTYVGTNPGLIERPISETNRQTYNAWVRAGCPLTITGTAAQQENWTATYTPVAPGTGGAILAGQPGHPLYSTFDPAATIEHNSSGTLTTGGSYWQTNASAFYYSIDGVHPTQGCYAALSSSVPVASIIAP